MNKSKINVPSAGTEADSSTTAQNQHVSQPNANTNVIGSQVPPMSLIEAKEKLVSKSNELDFKNFIDFIMSCLKDIDGFLEWFDKNYKGNDFSIVARVGEGFYVDLRQIRVLYSLMSSNNKVVSPPSESKTAVT